MLCGFPPFYDDNNQKLFEAITNCTYEFPSPYFDKVSDKAKDLITKILVADPKERLNAD
jgi:calcium/calmodulin-dependent protein kinase I